MAILDFASDDSVHMLRCSELSTLQSFMAPSATKLSKVDIADTTFLIIPGRLKPTKPISWQKSATKQSNLLWLNSKFMDYII